MRKQNDSSKDQYTWLSYPIGSMYVIYGNIYHQYTPNVSIYTIHGSYGYWVVLIMVSHGCMSVPTVCLDQVRNPHLGQNPTFAVENIIYFAIFFRVNLYNVPPQPLTYLCWFLFFHSTIDYYRLFSTITPRPFPVKSNISPPFQWLLNPICRGFDSCI